MRSDEEDEMPLIHTLEIHVSLYYAKRRQNEAFSTIVLRLAHRKLSTNEESDDESVRGHVDVTSLDYSLEALCAKSPGRRKSRLDGAALHCCRPPWHLAVQWRFSGKLRGPSLELLVRSHFRGNYPVRRADIH